MNAHHEQKNEDWLYGAEQALAWVLGQDAMAPAKAFRLTAERRVS